MRLASATARHNPGCPYVRAAMSGSDSPWLTTWRLRPGGPPDVGLVGNICDVLHELMLNAGRVLSREHLQGRVYRWGEEVESNAVEVHIHGLRRKLGADFIRNVRGVGYRFISDSSR